jgi:hypothetical protein
MGGDRGVGDIPTPPTPSAILSSKQGSYTGSTLGGKYTAQCSIVLPSLERIR